MTGRRVAGALAVLAGMALWYFALFQFDVTVGNPSADSSLGIERVANLQMLFFQLCLVVIGGALLVGGCVLYVGSTPPLD